MVDILFGESEAACMRYAKTVRTLPAGEGGPDTVLCLAFMLDIGDIQKAIDSSYRQELIFSMYSQDQDGHDEAACQELKEAGPSYVRQLARLEEVPDLFPLASGFLPYQHGRIDQRYVQDLFVESLNLGQKYLK